MQGIASTWGVCESYVYINNRVRPQPTGSIMYRIVPGSCFSFVPWFATLGEVLMLSWVRGCMCPLSRGKNAAPRSPNSGEIRVATLLYFASCGGLSRERFGDTLAGQFPRT